MSPVLTSLLTAEVGCYPWTAVEKEGLLQQRNNKTEKCCPQFRVSKASMSTVYLKHPFLFSQSLCSYLPIFWRYLSFLLSKTCLYSQMRSPSIPVFPLCFSFLVPFLLLPWFPHVYAWLKRCCSKTCIHLLQICIFQLTWKKQICLVVCNWYVHLKLIVPEHTDYS